jgi:hypothetical protein
LDISPPYFELLSGAVEIVGGYSASRPAQRPFQPLVMFERDKEFLLA